MNDVFLLQTILAVEEVRFCWELFLQVGNYIQPLWETIRPVNQTHVDIYNGAVEAGTTLTSNMTWPHKHKA